MNFFEHQDQAQRLVKVLTLYSAIAVTATIAAFNIPVYFAVLFLNGKQHSIPLLQWILGKYCIVTSILILGIFLAISLMRALRLRSGGEAVARMIGATAIEPANATMQEKKLINIVEEMSIASGIKVPKMLMLPGELAINAFVAGNSIKDAVIVVTQGALENLSKYELQGLIAHEFSHILNGDMTLNVKLISRLAGLVAIGQLGGYCLRVSNCARSSREKPIFIIITLGFSLTIIGAIGIFLSRLIKASIVRRHEFLADAAAVQFTRNPHGIASALNCIRNSRSNLGSRHAEDISHMCFAPSLQSLEKSLFGTHPNLNARIKKIDPLFNFEASQAKTARFNTPARYTPALESWSQAPAHATLPIGSATTLSETIGNPNLRHIDYAEALHNAIPERALLQARNNEGAIALIYAILLCKNENHVKAAIDILHTTENEAFVDETLEHFNALSSLSPIIQLPLFDIAINSVKNGSAIRINSLLQTANKIVNFDAKFTLSELAFLILIEKYLQPLSKLKTKAIDNYSFAYQSIAIVLAAITQLNESIEANQKRHFEVVMRYFKQDISNLSMPQASSIPELKSALQQLARLSPLLKRPLVEACTDAVLRDKRVTVADGELLRSICAILDCPMPPILPSQSKIV